MKAIWMEEFSRNTKKSKDKKYMAKFRPEDITVFVIVVYHLLLVNFNTES